MIVTVAPYLILLMCSCALLHAFSCRVRATENNRVTGQEFSKVGQQNQKTRHGAYLPRFFFNLRICLALYYQNVQGCEKLEKQKTGG